MRSDFSDIYGVKKDEIRNLITTDGLRMMSVRFLDMFPKAVYLSGLRKSKARGMVTAMQEGTYVNGNHMITYEGFTFSFYYRGTLIYEWNMHDDEERAIDALDYENTASTVNQRKEIAKSIQNFRESVLRL